MQLALSANMIDNVTQVLDKEIDLHLKKRQKYVSSFTSFGPPSVCYIYYKVSPSFFSSEGKILPDLDDTLYPLQDKKGVKQTFNPNERFITTFHYLQGICWQARNLSAYFSSLVKNQKKMGWWASKVSSGYQVARAHFVIYNAISECDFHFVIECSSVDSLVQEYATYPNGKVQSLNKVEIEEHWKELCVSEIARSLFIDTFMTYFEVPYISIYPLFFEEDKSEMAEKVERFLENLSEIIEKKLSKNLNGTNRECKKSHSMRERLFLCSEKLLKRLAMHERIITFFSNCKSGLFLLFSFESYRKKKMLKVT